jgi:hypothetical protein
MGFVGGTCTGGCSAGTVWVGAAKDSGLVGSSAARHK